MKPNSTSILNLLVQHTVFYVNSNDVTSVQLLESTEEPSYFTTTKLAPIRNRLGCRLPTECGERPGTELTK